MCNYHHSIFSCGCTQHTHTTKCELEKYRDVAIARSTTDMDASMAKKTISLQSLAEKIRPTYRMHGYEEVYHAIETLCAECLANLDQEEKIKQGEIVKWRKAGPTPGYRVKHEGYAENHHRDGSLKHEIPRNRSWDMLRPGSRNSARGVGGLVDRTVSYPSKKPSPLDQKLAVERGGMPRLESERADGLADGAVKAVKKVRFGFAPLNGK